MRDLGFFPVSPAGQLATDSVLARFLDENLFRPKSVEIKALEDLDLVTLNV
jgi:hypothetical protein